MTQSLTLQACPRCRSPLNSPDDLVCARCGGLIYAAELSQLAAEAKWQEQFNPPRAVELLDQCLGRLPANSRQYAVLQAEIQRLRQLPPPPKNVQEPGSIPTARQETLPVAILKTGGSMALSLVVYQFSFGWVGATGFVLLILIHELGHVVANLYYGLRASPPIFIPYLGAVINLREAPRSARMEAVIGIAGPVAGAIATVACLALYFTNHSDLMLNLAWFGALMNLFNLLPVPPLDGGRVAAAISAWVWIPGIAGLVWMIVDELRKHNGSGILLIILFFAAPRIIKTLQRGGRSGPYYAIGKIAPVVIGLAYLALAGALYAIRSYCASRMGHSMF